MRKYLIEDKKYYKANLHSHSTCSDGKFSVEQNVNAYKGAGYSIYAVTDHCYTENFHERFSTDDFVVINGYENVIYDSKKFVADQRERRLLAVYHFNFYAKNPSTQAMVGVTKHGFERFFKNDTHPENKPSKFANDKYSTVKYNVKSINKMIKQADKEGWLVQYNHPVWSQNKPKDYLGLKGLWGMEILNNDCIVGGYNEENPYVYDLMLRDGQTLCATGNDDNHSQKDRFGCFTMIGANSLDYQGVIDAMVRKDLYASNGPTIDYIYYENGSFYIKCSPVVKISIQTGVRKTRVVANDGPITTAQLDDFDFSSNVGYYRFEITDQKGKKAYTRAYFPNEIKG